jgi:hypothetical protein
VHADHDELTGPAPLGVAQLLEDVQAVHAAERPEVEDHEATAQVRQSQRLATGVQPPAPGQLRRAHAGRATLI